MNKALIFGIGGFVGSYLAIELKSHGYQVYGTDLYDEDALSDKYDGYFRCNILDKNAVFKIINDVQPLHIINLAAISSVEQSWKIPDITMQVNVNGTLNIIDACIQLNIKPRILLIGSSEEYICCTHPMNEDTPLNASNPYGISKVAQEQFAKIYREKYNWKIFYVRSFNHIGIGQKTTFVIPSWCKQAADISKSGKKGIITVGNLDISRDFTDVRDIVRAYRLVIESQDFNQIFNVGSGNSYNLRSLLEIIVSFARQKIDIVVDQNLLRKNDNMSIICDNTKIKERLHWTPSYSLRDTLFDIYNSFYQSL